MLTLAGSLQASAGPALAASPLSWSSPTLIDPGSEASLALNGVSCPSASLCVAVDEYGNVVSSTEPDNAASWRVSRAYVNRTGYFSLDAVSCVGADFCFAGGGGTFRSSTAPAGGAGAWSSHATPQEPVPRSVSCPSRNLCVGVTYKGGVWSSTEPRGDRLAWKVASVNEGEHNTLYGISCPTASLCVAVDAGGDVLSSNEPTGDKTAWHSAAVDPGHAILGVSCASELLCVAVDQAGDVLSSTHPAGGASEWMVSEVEKGIAIRAVSCSGSLCVAVDEAGDVLSSTDPAGGAGAWSVVHVDEHLLRAVSCASESLCVATDTNGDVLTATDPTGPADAWVLAHVDTMTSPPLAAISCASASLCLAALYTTVLTSTDPAGGAGAWKLEKTPEGAASLGLGLSCPSASLCVGTGSSWVSASTEPARGAATWKEQTAWVYSPILNPEAEYFGPSGAVSCASESLCVADGDTFNDFNSLVTSTAPAGGPAQWYEAHIQGSGNKVSPPYQEDPILSVSCASTALCAAVDAAGNVLTSTDPGSSEGTWTIAPVDTHPLEDVSCPSEGLCVAVDDAGNVVYSTDPTGGSAAWTVSSIDSPYGLTAISCATTSLCVVVDDEGNVLASTDPTGGAGAWSVSDVDSSASASRALTAITCPSEELCVAVDNAGYAVTGTSSPPTVTPANTSAPVASGTPAPGQALSCSNGSWTGYPPPTFTYQWLRDGTPIAGASTGAYEVQAADQGYGLACQVTASNSAGSESATSNTLQVPAAQAPGGGGAGSGGSGGSSGAGGNPGTLTGTVSNAFVLNGVESVAARGTVKVTLTLPGPGTLRIVGKASAAQLAGASRTKRKRKTPVVIAQLRRTVSKAGRIVVTLVPTAGARTVLARQGKLKATVTITYTPKGGAPRSIVRTVTFKLKRRR